MRIVGWSLFAVGVLLAVSGGAKMAPVNATFPDTWWVFACGLTCGIVGVILCRARHTNEPVNQHLQEPALALAHDLRDLPSDDLLQRIDELLEGFVWPFAEARLRVIDRLGMSRGADVLVTMAYGERMLNRTWSAAADGHLCEAHSSYPESVRAFVEANRLSETATSRNSATRA